jgi:septin 7
MSDSRVHSCLYFIAPSGHGLKPLDVEFMQRLCDKVNIIPVIAKADTMTPEEIQLFKKQILNEIAQHKIKIYDFPEPLEEEEDAKALKQLKCRVPFAVVGANAIIEVDGKKIRGRRYPWGVAEGKIKWNSQKHLLSYYVYYFVCFQSKIWSIVILLRYAIW